jgi:hypothetical protein
MPAIHRRALGGASVPLWHKRRALHQSRLLLLNIEKKWVVRNHLIHDDAFQPGLRNGCLLESAFSMAIRIADFSADVNDFVTV